MVKKNRRPIFFNRRTGRRFIGKSKELVASEADLLASLSASKEYNHLGNYPITIPVNAKFIFYFRKEQFFTKKGTFRKIADLSNLYELPQDCLQKAGILFDDHLIFSHDGSRRVAHPTMNILEIELTSFDGV